MRRLAAEFFAGIGLVRLALEEAGFEVVFANDIERKKHAFYAGNFDDCHFLLGDVRGISGAQVPRVDLATASFPCTDLSLAGWRRGLSGEQSSMFWEFARILREMGGHRPPVVMLENVPSFATSHGGEDLAKAVKELNDLGYWCDLLELNARWWVPQSRPRVFIVGSLRRVGAGVRWALDDVRPLWVGRFAVRYPDLLMHAVPMKLPPATDVTLRDVVEKLPAEDPAWWDGRRLGRFLASLAPIQAARLESLTEGPELSWRTAYRRTRYGRPVWEIRPDNISGCLRAVRGGSSRQAVVEAGGGGVRVRWMTAREYARLMGAPDFDLTRGTENQALFGLGDAVCVSAVAWLARSYLAPLCEGELWARSGALMPA